MCLKRISWNIQKCEFHVNLKFQLWHRHENHKVYNLYYLSKTTLKIWCSQGRLKASEPEESNTQPTWLGWANGWRSRERDCWKTKFIMCFNGQKIVESQRGDTTHKWNTLSDLSLIWIYWWASGHGKMNKQYPVLMYFNCLFVI